MFLELQRMRCVQHVFDLVLYHGLNGVSARSEVFARVEFRRIFGDEFADLRGHGKTQIRVDVDLADAVFGSFGNHGLRHTLRARDIAAVLVAFIDEFLENR